jgi:hypothetical protein
VILSAYLQRQKPRLQAGSVRHGQAVPFPVPFSDLPFPRHTNARLVSSLTRALASRKSCAVCKIRSRALIIAIKSSSGAHPRAKIPRYHFEHGARVGGPKIAGIFAVCGAKPPRFSSGDYFRYRRLLGQTSFGLLHFGQYHRRSQRRKLCRWL